MDERRRATSAASAGSRRRRASRARAFAVADVAAGSRPTRDHRVRPRGETRDRFLSVTRRDVALALALARRSRRSSPSMPSLGGDVSPVRVARGAPLRSPTRTCRPVTSLGPSRAPSLERRSRGATSSSTMSSRRMNARVHECTRAYRSIDRFDRYARFNRNQPTNQPLEQTIDQFHRFDRYAWFNRHQLPEQTIDRSIDRSPTIRTITPMVQKVKHPVMGQSNPESIDRIRTHGSIDRYRSIDTDRPTARDTRPSGSGIHPSASRRRRHTRARTSGRRRPTRSRGLREHRLNLIQGNSWRKDRRATRRKKEGPKDRSLRSSRHGGGQETLEGNSSFVRRRECRLEGVNHGELWMVVWTHLRLRGRLRVVRGVRVSTE